MKIKTLLYFLPLILWMSVIYYSSSQPYHEQDMRPWLKSVLPEAFIKEHFSNLKINYDGNEVSIATKGVAGFVEFLIRKTAHVIAFMIFSALLLFALWNTTQLPKWKIITYTLISSFLFACSDELHQMLTGDRSPKFTDVKIDTAGALLGVVLFLIIRVVKGRRKS